MLGGFRDRVPAYLTETGIPYEDTLKSAQRAVDEGYKGFKDHSMLGVETNLALARDIRDLVAHLKDRGIGVLITDHNVRETLEVIDRAYIIHNGMMLMEGAPGDIVGNEDVRRVYLGDRFNL